MKHFHLVDSLYDISRKGTLTKLSTGKVIAKPIASTGYVNYNLSVKGKKFNVLAHRLVASKYIQNPDNLPHVNHINGIKTDNSVENLEWCTPKHNNQHMHDTGLWKSTETHKAAVSKNIEEGRKKAWKLNTKFTADDAKEFIRLKALGWSLRKIGEKYSVPHGTIKRTIEREDTA